MPVLWPVVSRRDRGRTHKFQADRLHSLHRPHTHEQTTLHTDGAVSNHCLPTFYSNANPIAKHNFWKNGAPHNMTNKILTRLKGWGLFPIRVWNHLSLLGGTGRTSTLLSFAPYAWRICAAEDYFGYLSQIRGGEMYWHFFLVRETRDFQVWWADIRLLIIAEI